MKRKAILIGSPNVKPELPGVDIDLRDMSEYLQSNTGGAWKKDEITVLRNPSKLTVDVQLLLSRDADYVFILCAGHGEHHIGANLSESVIYLQENEKMKITDINPKNKRHLVVVDACRGIVRINEDLQKMALNAKSESMMFGSVSNVDFRAEFDNAVMAAPEGRIVMYSCDIDQTAGDHGEGGVFTQSLLRSPAYFNNANSYGCTVVDCNESFNIAKTVTYKQNAPQSPVLDAGRRMKFYPFSIVV
ncbi:caspase family protein [Vibrio diazotrophicus]|uniref:Peptidase C14 caspase domain-containing protein n=1 Tax=Vibrio diazotrophicus TaxID=685 RepID=A0ABX4W6B0_VIBDI|nr:caspase family protein [Vibrio diazotrophicus]PNH99248.1 hypothetical protein C1O25_18010 [Vibrio diazotrophicus]